MFYVSLLANVAILVPVLLSLWNNTAGIEIVFGGDTVARRILACVYFAIAVVSLGLLVAALTNIPNWQMWAVALFVIQIIYKLATLPAVGLSNPVVVTNVAVVALHSVTLVSFYLSKG